MIPELRRTSPNVVYLGDVIPMGVTPMGVINVEVVSLHADHIRAQVEPDPRRLAWRLRYPVRTDA